ncbi:MAG: bifunctional glutamate N-acetyltransferase/amino-acid acetyltransferase ArgJ [Peptococcaceae bacterium]|nr:bifunctional glutamate N-acetyltransferase/amino-acid acetyltransferase ArgJ [Peptococcaceae bacterium]MBO5140810.1 bifunctional glutamate N-acetyltransferase/amino-acid acetyltransferase ArgJ [Peptococcaceae bacterium]MBO5430223.1 bifunctional glutamate N-acetyltransferase/amino-acid acetyltransferase ArgJ [Peptococcaceae bacterium]
MQILENGSVTSPRGFTAAAVAAEIKYTGRTDLAIVYSKVPAQAAAVYTLNRFKAAPLRVTEENISNGVAQAIVVNSGIANAGMGAEGMRLAREMSDCAAEALDIAKDDVIVASTGVIGMPLPMDRVKAGVQKAAKALYPDGGHDVAKAIMTTDTVCKEMAVQLRIDGKLVTIGAMAKGSGMIHPNMATMLGFITTDVNIDNKALQAAFKANIDDSFNMVSVDGDTSTNDMVVILANGQAGNTLLTEESPDFPAFKQALREICIEMAQKIAGDGEGATKLVECTVTGAATKEDARLAAKAIIASSLVKTAIYGNDANWGRIACAAGYSGAQFDPDKVNIFIGDVQVAQNGMGLEFDEAKATETLKQKKVNILVKFNIGTEEATAWGCDLTYDYVSINADYRS